MAAVTTIVAIGLPLVGLRVFLPTDNLYLHPPWSEAAPPDLNVTNPLLADVIDGEIPRRIEVRERMYDADLPLWSSLPQGGLPLSTQIAGGVFSPLNVAYLLLPVWYAPAVTKLLETIAAVGFTFLFIRRLGLARPAALMGGFLYTFSAFQVAWTNWPHPGVGALIPALFWSVERAIQRPGLMSLVPVSLVTAALLLAGFPPVAGFALLLAGIYALVRTVAATDRMRGRVVRLTGLGGAVFLGVGIAAFQVLPFVSRIAGISLGYREQTGASHPPWQALLTTLVPDAYGSPADHVSFGAPANYLEYQSFLGVTTVVLIVVGAVWRRRTGLVSGARPYFEASLVVLVGLVYFGGAPLELIQDFPLTRPLFGINGISRMRSLIGLFAACYAAVGFQTIATSRRELGPSRWSRFGVAACALAIFGLLVPAMIAAQQNGRLLYLGWKLVVPVLAAAVAIAMVARARRDVSGVPWAVWVLPVVFAVEVLAFTLPYWPRVPRSEFYPVTETHLYLYDNLGHDRIAAEHRTLYPGATRAYGIRSVTAHMFQDPAWAELLLAVDPRAFDPTADDTVVRRPTFPHLSAEQAVAASPVLDRLGVRYFAMAPHLAAFGDRHVVTTSAGETLALHAGGSVEAPLRVEAVREVEVELAAPVSEAMGTARLRVELLDEEGHVVGMGERRLFPADPRTGLTARGEPWGAAVGAFRVSVTEPTGPRRASPETVRLTLDARQGELTLAATADGHPALTVTTSRGDGLRIARSEGAVLYERLNALPRIRWAARASVVTSGEERVARLRAGVPPDTVILGDESPPGSGHDADVKIIEDSGDRIVVDVHSRGAGYLVIADTLHRGWEASVDGETAEILLADHAVGAVYVTDGRHQVTFDYEPEIWNRGILISAATALVLITLAAVGFWLRKRGRVQSPPGVTAPSRT